MIRPHSDDLRLAGVTNFSTSCWFGEDPLSDDAGGTTAAGYGLSVSSSHRDSFRDLNPILCTGLPLRTRLSRTLSI
ncbi:MAG: hypothetical protein OEM92_05570 [Gammaproteobacteria bacterium]|nr:hypothetical protein [Gammaproteobacteria bacterium]